MFLLHVHKISLKNTQNGNIGWVWEEKLEILKTGIEEIIHDNLLNVEPYENIISWKSNQCKFCKCEMNINMYFLQNLGFKMKTAYQCVCWILNTSQKLCKKWTENKTVKFSDSLKARGM